MDQRLYDYSMVRLEKEQVLVEPKVVETIINQMQLGGNLEGYVNADEFDKLFELQKLYTIIRNLQIQYWMINSDKVSSNFYEHLKEIVGKDEYTCTRCKLGDKYDGKLCLYCVGELKSTMELGYYYIYHTNNSYGNYNLETIYETITGGKDGYEDAVSYLHEHYRKGNKVN